MYSNTSTPSYLPRETLAVSETTQSSRNYEVISLILAITVIVLAPLLSLIPLIGFLLPITALYGAIIAYKGLKQRSSRAVAAIGLSISTPVFVATMAFSVWWNFTVAIPAISDFEGLNQLVKELRESAPVKPT